MTYFVLPSNTVIRTIPFVRRSTSSRFPLFVYCHIPTALFLPLPVLRAFKRAIYSRLIISTTEMSFGVASKLGGSVDDVPESGGSGAEPIVTSASFLSPFFTSSSLVFVGRGGGMVCRTKGLCGFSCPNQPVPRTIIEQNQPLGTSMQT